MCGKVGIARGRPLAAMDDANNNLLWPWRCCGIRSILSISALHLSTVLSAISLPTHFADPLPSAAN